MLLLRFPLLLKVVRVGTKLEDCFVLETDLPVIQTLLTASVVESINTNSLSSPLSNLKFTLGNYSNDVLSTIDPDQILQVLIYVENIIYAPNFIVLNVNSTP